MSKPRWSKIGELNFAELIRHADSGNTDAGRRLLECASNCLREDRPLPDVLRIWLASQLAEIIEWPKDAGKILRVAPQSSRPPAFADDLNARLEREAFEKKVAWAAYHAVRSGEGPTKLTQKEGATAFEIVAAWARRERHCTAEQVRRWYSSRLPKMRAEQSEIDRITKELDVLDGSAK